MVCASSWISLFLASWTADRGDVSHANARASVACGVCPTVTSGRIARMCCVVRAHRHQKNICSPAPFCCTQWKCFPRL
eukprot:9006352-Karenia_brevis.AAC.1